MLRSINTRTTKFVLMVCTAVLILALCLFPAKKAKAATGGEIEGLLIGILLTQDQADVITQIEYDGMYVCPQISETPAEEEPPEPSVPVEEEAEIEDVAPTEAKALLLQLASEGAEVLMATDASEADAPTARPLTVTGITGEGGEEDEEEEASASNMPKAKADGLVELSIIEIMPDELRQNMKGMITVRLANESGSSITGLPVLLQIDGAKAKGKVIDVEPGAITQAVFEYQPGDVESIRVKATLDPGKSLDESTREDNVKSKTIKVIQAVIEYDGNEQPFDADDIPDVPIPEDHSRTEWKG